MTTNKLYEQLKIMNDDQAIACSTASLMYLCQMKYKMSERDLRYVKAYIDYLRYVCTKA